MKSTRIWRLGTAALAASALLMTTAGGVATANPVTDLTDEVVNNLPADELQGLLDELGLDNVDQLLDLIEQESAEEHDAEAPATASEEGDVPGTDLGGFIGTAEGTALELGVGLPAELAEGLEPVLTGLGIRDEETGGIRIAFADTVAELQRAAAGEEVEGLAKALHTNLLLDSPEGESPGACTGGDTVELPPDQDVPLLRIGVAGIDCEQTDERAFAHAELTEVTISLAGLIEAGLPEDIREGFRGAIEDFNTQLLAELNDGACDPESEGNLNDLFEGLLGEGQNACEALELELANPWEVDVPLVSVQGLSSTSEVTADDDHVTAEARATLAGANVLGMVCIGGDGGDRLSSNATAHTDGQTGEQSSGVHDTEGRHCPATASILQLVSDPEVVGSVRLFDAELRNALDGNLEELIDGVEQLFEALGTTVYTAGQPYGQTDGAGAVAGVTPLNIVATAPFSELPVFEDTPLGDISVNLSALSVEAAVNAEPDGPVTPAEVDEPAEPTEDLPRTGAGAAGLLGLAALGAAAAMRRRDED